MLTTDQLPAVLPRPARRALRVGDRAGAQPVLDQHLPELAAGPPVPGHRAQRRDQHDQGQPQPHAGPRGQAGTPTCSTARPARPSELGLERIFPVTASDFSDSATFDEVLELLHLSGRSLPHAVLMMIPEAWENHDEMDAGPPGLLPVPLRDHGALGRAGRVCFTDGTLIGAVLDRNGLRPGRWWQTKDDLVVLASEVGVLDIPAADVVAKGRLQPGRMFLRRHRRRAGSSPTTRSRARWPPSTPTTTGCTPGWSTCPRCPSAAARGPATSPSSAASCCSATPRRSCASCCTPMAASGAEPIGSMGTDTPVAALSDRSRLLYDYFGQLFAQVTNPPLDAIREELVTSLGRTFGPEQNLLAGHPGVLPAGRACPSRSSTTTSWPRSCTSTTTATCPASPRCGSPATSTSTAAAPALAQAIERPADQGQQGHRRRRPGHRAVRPGLRRAARPDPVAADDRRGPPPPGARAHPHGGRPGRRVRRLPRGAPRRAAARLRRGRGQPLPGLRDRSRT